MNISKEQIDQLNALVKIEIEPQDYQEQVEKSIRENAKKAQMPGFRPGKVPVGMVKKLYGKSIMAEEVNRLLNEKLYSWLDEEKVSFLANPLPKEDINNQNDFETPGKMVFAYEIGLKPEVDAKVEPGRKFNYKKVNVSDEVLNKEVDALRKRYGQIVDGDTAGAEDILSVTVTVEGEEEGNNMIQDKPANIFLNRLSEEEKKPFIGLEKGAELTADLHAVWPENDVLARMLGVTEDIAADIQKLAHIKVDKVHSLKEAELDEAFYEKVFGAGVVNSEEEFRAKVKEGIENYYGQESDRLFFKDVSETLMKETTISLPEDFLKRWIKTVSEKPLNDHDLEHEFKHYKEYLQWDLIEEKLLTDNDIKVEPSEVMEYVKESLRRRYREYGISDMPEEELEKSARNVLAKREEARSAFQALREQKLLELFKRSYKLEEELLDPEAFNKQ